VGVGTTIRVDHKLQRTRRQRQHSRPAGAARLRSRSETHLAEVWLRERAGRGLRGCVGGAAASRRHRRARGCSGGERRCEVTAAGEAGQGAGVMARGERGRGVGASAVLRPQQQQQQPAARKSLPRAVRRGRCMPRMTRRCCAVRHAPLIAVSRAPLQRPHPAACERQREQPRPTALPCPCPHLWLARARTEVTQTRCLAQTCFVEAVADDRQR
jgi:hypothetical protein